MLNHDNYLHEKDNDNKIEQYDKQDKSSNKQTPTIPRIKLKWQGIYQCQMQRLKNRVSWTTPEQLNRGVSFAEKDESLSDQNISIAGHTFTDRPHYQFTNLKAAKKVAKYTSR